MNLIRFRKITQEKYDSIEPDDNTLYLVTDSNKERLYLGNHLFNSRALVDVILDTDNGKYRYVRNDGTDTEIDNIEEYLFDPNRSYYDHDKKSIILVFEDAPDDVEKPLNEDEIDEWALEIDLDDLSEKILNEVSDLKDELTDGTEKAEDGTDYLVVKFAERAEKDYDGNKITSTYTKVSTFNDEIDRIDEELNNRYTEDETEALLEDFMSERGFEDTKVRNTNDSYDFDPGDSIDMTKLDDFNWVMLRFDNHNSGLNEITHTHFRPKESSEGDKVKILIQRDPERFAQLEKQNGSFDYEIIDKYDEVKDGFDCTLQLWGVKVKEDIQASDVEYDSETNVEEKIDDLYDTKSDTDHTHTESDITDLDKYTKDEVDDELDGKSDTDHTHEESDITDLDKYTQNEVDNKLDDKSDTDHEHTESDITDLDKYSKDDIDDKLDDKSDTGHEHTESDITDLDKYDQDTVDSKLDDKSDTDHTHSESDITDLDKYDQNEIDDLLGEKADLDSNDKILLDQLPDESKSRTYVRESSDDRPSDPLEGDKLFETDTGDSFIYDGEEWLTMAEADWENVDLEWSNINSKPSTATRWPEFDEVTDKPSTYEPSEHGDSAHSENYSKEGHEHEESDITDLDKYTQDEVDNKLDDKSDTDHTHPISDVDDLQDELDSKSEGDDFDASGDYDNLRARSTTKDDVGLGDVTNDEQATKSEFDDHVDDTSNPHDVNASDVGLGDVPNWSGSTDESLGTSDSKIPSQNAVKSYVDDNVYDGDTFDSSGNYSNLRAQATTAGDVGLDNVPNWSGSTDNSLGTSDSTIPSQGAVKSYVDDNVYTGDEFNSSGTYDDLRAKSTTKDDVGLDNVTNDRQAISSDGYEIKKDGDDGDGIINFKTE